MTPLTLRGVRAKGLCRVVKMERRAALSNYRHPAMVAAGSKSATNAQQLQRPSKMQPRKEGPREQISRMPDLGCLTFSSVARLRDLTIVPVPEGTTSINGTQNPSSSAPGARRSFCHTREANRVIRARHRDRGLGLQPACHACDRRCDAILEKAKRVCVLTVTKERRSTPGGLVRSLRSTWRDMASMWCSTKSMPKDAGLATCLKLT